MIFRFYNWSLLLAYSLMMVGCEGLAIFSPEQESTAFYRNINLANQGKEKPFYTFLTYNIHMGFNIGQDPWDADEIGATQNHLLKLVEAIQSVDADFVALQEVADDRSNTEIKNQLKFLAEELNMNYAYGVDGENEPGQHGIRDLFATGREGNAILSKYEIINVENAIIIHKINKWRAGCLKVDVKISDDTFITTLNAHLTPSFDTLEVNLQIDNVLEFASKQKFPTVILGDFNKLPNSVYIKRITEEYLDTCDQVENENSDFVKRYGTFFPGELGSRRIDYIFIQPDVFGVVDVGLLAEEYWDLSDHVGYFAMIEFGMGGT